MIVYAALQQSVCSSLLEPHFGNRTISWGERFLALRTRIAAGVPLVGDGSLRQYYECATYLLPKTCALDDSIRLFEELELSEKSEPYNQRARRSST
jgi:hypothetical protein